MMFKMVGKYIWNIIIALDQLANTLIGGDPDMTLSGTMGRLIRTSSKNNKRCKLCKIICRLLNKVDPSHCEKQDIAEADEGKDSLIKWE